MFASAHHHHHHHPRMLRTVLWVTLWVLLVLLVLWPLPLHGN